MQQQPAAPSVFDRNRILLKGMLVGFLILVMLIPGVFVTNLVRERQDRQQQVVDEVSSKWAGPQTVTGPILMLPYREAALVNGKTSVVVKTACILPDELHISGNMSPAEKKRSLYRVMLYNGNVALKGRFGKLPLAALQIPPEAVIWSDVRLVINITDMRGIEEQVALSWNGTEQLLDAGLPPNSQVKEGLSAPVAVNADGTAEFSMNIRLRGSDRLYFIPVGKVTDVNIAANWKDPAFDGQYLPTTSAVTDKSFKANWKVLPLSHSYPQYWRDNAQDLDKEAFGVRLIQPVDGYAKTNRAVKYALMFIALTFTFFFFLEILQKHPIHAIQYILVGIALTIFYTLLLSISEYTGFDAAYFIAAIATISLISSYVWSVFKNGKTAGGFTVALTMLYGYIFVLIQLEDYALLFGSIGLFVILAIIMFFSRKIDWYATARQAISEMQDGDIPYTQAGMETPAVDNI